MRDGWHRNGSYTVDGQFVAWVTLPPGDGFWWGHLLSGGQVDYFPTRRLAREWCEKKVAEAASSGMEDSDGIV